MSISSSIGRCLMVLMLAQGMVAHAADNVDGDAEQGFAGLFKSKSAQKVEAPRAAAPEPEVRVLDKVDVERERLANLAQEVACGIKLPMRRVRHPVRHACNFAMTGWTVTWN